MSADSTVGSLSSQKSLQRARVGHTYSAVVFRRPLPLPASASLRQIAPPKVVTTTRGFAGQRRKNDSMFSLQISGPTSRSFSAPRPRFFKRWLSLSTSCSAMCQHSHRASIQACGCYKETVDLLRLSRTTRNDSSSNPSQCKCRMMQVRHV